MNKEFEKIKEILADKLIVRLDKNFNPKTEEYEHIVVFVNSEKKTVGHCIVSISPLDKSGLKTFKKIITDRFDISIKGYKNWKKLLRGSYGE